MNEHEEVVEALPSSIDDEIRASRKKLDTDFADFWQKEDSKSSDAIQDRDVGAREAPIVPAEVLAERDRLKAERDAIAAENERLKVYEREIDISSDEDFARQYTKPYVDTWRSTLEELSGYLDAPPEKIQEEFLNKVWNEWSAAGIQKGSQLDR